MKSQKAYKLARTIAALNHEAKKKGQATIGKPSAQRVTDGSKSLAHTPSKGARNEFKYVH